MKLFWRLGIDDPFAVTRPSRGNRVIAAGMFAAGALAAGVAAVSAAVDPVAGIVLLLHFFGGSFADGSRARGVGLRAAIRAARKVPLTEIADLGGRQHGRVRVRGTIRRIGPGGDWVWRRKEVFVTRKLTGFGFYDDDSEDFLVADDDGMSAKMDASSALLFATPASDWTSFPPTEIDNVVSGGLATWLRVMGQVTPFRVRERYLCVGDRVEVVADVTHERDPSDAPLGRDPTIRPCLTRGDALAVIIPL